MTRPRTGVRDVYDLDGGGLVLALYGETDLDDVMLAVALNRSRDEGAFEVDVYPRIPYRWNPPPPPSLSEGDSDGYFARWGEWYDRTCHRIPVDLPTDELLAGCGEPIVGWFRRFPWCTCGDWHDWHIEPAGGPGRGAWLGVMFNGEW